MEGITFQCRAFLTVQSGNGTYMPLSLASSLAATLFSCQKEYWLTITRCERLEPWYPRVVDAHTYLAKLGLISLDLFWL